MTEYTPMMQHYLKTHEEYKDCILFYRLGDFYEMFFDDAKVVSKELELTLTGKSCDCGEKAKRGSLLWVLDKTKTAMGARMLRSFVEQPLIEKRGDRGTVRCH